MGNFPLVLRQTGFQRAFVCTHFTTQLIIFLLLKKEVNLKWDVQHNASVTLACSFEKWEKNEFSRLLIYPHFTRQIMHASLSGLFLFRHGIKGYFCYFLPRSRCMGFLNFWYPISGLTAWSLKILKGKTHFYSPPGHSLRDMCLEGYSVFECLVQTWKS